MHPEGDFSSCFSGLPSARGGQLTSAGGRAALAAGRQEFGLSDHSGLVLAVAAIDPEQPFTVWHAKTCSSCESGHVNPCNF